MKALNRENQEEQNMSTIQNGWRPFINSINWQAPKNNKDQKSPERIGQVKKINVVNKLPKQTILMKKNLMLTKLKEKDSVGSTSDQSGTIKSRLIQRLKSSSSSSKDYMIRTASGAGVDMNNPELRPKTETPDPMFGLTEKDNPDKKSKEAAGSGSGMDDLSDTTKAFNSKSTKKESILELKDKYPKRAIDEDSSEDPSLGDAAAAAQPSSVVAGKKIPEAPENLLRKTTNEGTANRKLQQEMGASSQAGSQIPITFSDRPKRGMNVKPENPSVRFVAMSPASPFFGGDDVEVVVSPLYDVVIQMPKSIQHIRPSNALLSATPIKGLPNMVALKFAPIQDPMPVSLHLVDVDSEIYTFTILGTPVDLAWEYPKTIIIKKRRVKQTQLGASNPASFLDAMDIDDAVPLVVGSAPRTDEYQIEITTARYMHYEAYGFYGFRIFRKDHGNLDPNDLKFTMWANNRRIDGGENYSLSRQVEWAVNPALSQRESRRHGYTVLRVFVQIRGSILDFEEWNSAFITVADPKSYTRFDFKPIIREFRPMPKSYTD
jgi:hypothetical protein